MEENNNSISEEEISAVVKSLCENIRGLKPEETPKQYASLVAQEAIAMFLRRNGWKIT